MKSQVGVLMGQLGVIGGASGKEPTGDPRDTDSIRGFGRFPGGGHGNPRQYSCLENPVDTGSWWATEQLHFRFSLSCIGEGNGNPLQCSWDRTESDTTEVMQRQHLYVPLSL